MISANAKLSIQKIPLECLQVKCHYDLPRYPERLLHYIHIMEHSNDYPGIISVVPSDSHPGMFAVLDGHHRLCAAIMVRKPDLLCLVIEEPVA